MRRLSARRADEGFTLIELLIVVVVLPLIVGAIALGFITTLNNKNTTSTRLSDSHDAQITSQYFVRDVKSAQYVSTSNSPLCGSTNYLLGLAWASTKADGTVVSDSAIYTANPANGTLVRTFCSGGNTSTAIMSHGAFPTTPAVSLATCPNDSLGSSATACDVAGSTTYAAVTIACTDGSTSCANSGAIAATPQTNTAVGVNRVKLSLLSYDSTLAVNGGSASSGFNFSAVSSPQGWSAAGAGQPGGGTGATPALDLIGPSSTVTFQGSQACALTVNGVAAINTASSPSVTLGNNNTFSATEVYSQTSNPVSPANNSPPVVVGPPLTDPYTASAAPKPGDPGVTVKNGSWSASGVLDGIYYVTGSMSVGNNVTTGPDGVLIYLAQSSIGSIDLTGNNTLSLTKTVAKYDPISIWVANGSTISLGGNGNVTTIGGTVYDPAGGVALSGGGNSGGVNAAGIVAKTLSCSGGGNGVGFNAGPLTTTTALSANPTTGTDGQAETLTATVTYTDPSTSQQVAVPAGAGDVVFQLVDTNGNTTTDCAAPAPITGANGQATCTTGPLSASLSKYKVTATYQGTSSYGPSSATLTGGLVVLEPTTTTVATTSSNLVSGQTATITATVAGKDGSSPTGSVTFAGVNCTGSNVKTLPGTSPDTVTCTTTSLLASNAPYTVTATYAESANPSTWQGSNGSVAVPVARASTTTTVMSSKPSSKPSQQVVFTASVSPAPNAGTVSWTLAATTGPGVSCSTSTQLTSGTATCTVNGNTFVNGNAPYTVTATYSGNADYATSKGSTTQNVASVGTVTVASAPTHGSGSARRKYTESARVTGNDGGIPTGTVNFYLCASTTTGCSAGAAGAVTLPGALNASGVAASTQSATLTTGVHYCFAAVYQGTTDYATSSDLSTTVQCFTA